MLNAFYDELADRNGHEPMPMQEFKRRKQVVNELSKRSTEKTVKMKKTVYVDMDGVLVDFQSGLDLQPDDIKEEYEGRFDEIPGLFADQFARAEGLHGLFTGMIVSELNEALLYQVETTQEELDRENVKLARRLRALLDERVPLSEIPKRMLAMDDVHSPLTTFNYKNFHYL